MIVAKTAVGVKLGAKSIVLAALDNVPAAPVIAVGLTVPWWRQWLETVSETAALVGPIIAALVAIAKLYSMLRKTPDTSAGIATGGTAVSALGAAASAAAKRSGPIVLAGLALAAIVATVAALFSGKAQAAPAPPNPAKISAPRKRSKDAAGDDGDTTGDVPDGAPGWYVAAAALVGAHEGTRRKPNPVVVDMFRDSGFPQIRDTEGTAWCAAFVGSLLKRAGHPGTGSLMARSYERWGDRLDAPRVGCVVVMWRGSKTGGLGHVGFYAGETKTHVIVLGGNQSDAVSFAKFPKNRVLSYRWPRGLSKSKTIAGAGAAAGVSAASAGAAITEEMAAPLPNAPVEGLQSIEGPLHALGLHSRRVALAAAVVTFLIAAGIGYNRWLEHTRGQRIAAH